MGLRASGAVDLAGPKVSGAVRSELGEKLSVRLLRVSRLTLGRFVKFDGFCRRAWYKLQARRGFVMFFCPDSPGHAITVNSRLFL